MKNFLSKKDDQQNIHQQFESTQKFLEIEQIRDDVLVLKDGSLRSVMMVSSINMELRAEEEKMSIISAYQGALNSLEFPLQFLVQSRKLDLTNYLALLESSAQNQPIPLLKEQTNEYILFLKDILSNVNVMDKRFFAVIPYYPNIVAESSKGVLSFLGIKKQGQTAEAENENYLQNKQQLQRRIQLVIGLFTDIGLTLTPLPTEALVELFYACYNPETAGHEHIKGLDTLGANYISTRNSIVNPEMGPEAGGEQ